MDDSLALLKLINGKSNVRVELGEFRALDFPRVIVDVGGGRIPAETATEYRPEVNEQVQVLFVDGKPWMLGPAVPKPGEGVVVTVGDDLVNVQTDIGLVSAPFPHGLVLTSGEQVKLMWSQGPFVVARMSTSPEPAVDPGATPGVGGARQEKFTAVLAGSWQLNGSRWASDEPRASNGYVGAWHYGTKIADTIPANASLTSVEVFIRYASRFGNPPNFALHSQPSRGGEPDTVSSFAWAVNDGWNRLPPAQEATYFNALKAGGGKFGLSLNHGGVNRFASLGAEPDSGAIRIAWST